jgi:hypothetical protein
MIFDEWANRCAKNPEEFDKWYQGEEPAADFGERCMRFFVQIAEEMDAKNLLPRPE